MSMDYLPWRYDSNLIRFFLCLPLDQRTAVVQSMAISAASVFGGASATVAEATTAAILGAAGATATATTSTTATLVSILHHKF